MTHLRLLALSVLLAGAVACGGAAPRVDLSGTWPEKTLDYYDVTSAWTREGHLLDTVRARKRQILEVHATLKSPEWRTAYSGFLAQRALLPEPERQALLAKMQKEHGDYYEVELFVVIDDKRYDLHKGDRSDWRVALVADNGVEIRAKEIVRDRRPRSLIRDEFPHLSHFHEVYIARFPRTVEIFHPGAARLSLKVGSARGAVELVWDDQRTAARPVEP